MAIKFKNIVSDEIRVAETEPMIAAMYNSSDRGPNANQGQDFGWRLAPEVVVQIRRIMGNQQLMLQIAQMYNLIAGEVDEKAVLQYISDQTSVEDAPVAQMGDYQDKYIREIQELEDANSAAPEEASVEQPVKKGRQIQ